MKSCPTCNRTYPDDTLAFCLADGSLLSAPYDPQATVILPSATTFIPPAAPTVAQTTERMSAPSAPAKTSTTPFYLVIGLLLVLIFVGGIGVIAAFLWRSSPRIVGTPTPSPTPYRSPTPASSPVRAAEGYKKRADFATEEEYGSYMQSVLKDRMRVRVITEHYHAHVGFTGTYYQTADTTTPPCFVIWDESIDTTGVSFPPEAPADAAIGHGYWVMWYDVEIVE
jgi:hypothetical protein